MGCGTNPPAEVADVDDGLETVVLGEVVVVVIDLAASPMMVVHAVERSAALASSAAMRRLGTGRW
jgi:hypothetical protein